MKVPVSVLIVGLLACASASAVCFAHAAFTSVVLAASR